MATVDPDKGYYYDITTGDVVQGRVRGWMNRMGPYATRAEAEEALRLATARTEAWDEQDQEEHQTQSLWPPDEE